MNASRAGATADPLNTGASKDGDALGPQVAGQRLGCVGIDFWQDALAALDDGHLHSQSGKGLS